VNLAAGRSLPREQAYLPSSLAFGEDWLTQTWQVNSHNAMHVHLRFARASDINHSRLELNESVWKVTAKAVHLTSVVKGLQCADSNQP